MLYKCFIGTYTVKIQGFDLEKLCNAISKTCKVYMLCVESECLVVKLSWLDRNKLKYIADNHSCVITELAESGLLHHLFRYRRRYGFIFGAISAIVLTLFLSNFAVRFDFIFEGNEDIELTEDITAVLISRGLSVGTYLPNVDFRSLNAYVASQFDGISFLSIGHKGPVVLVNIGLASDRADFQEKRSPSNIIAERDGVVIMPIVLSGQLSVLIGDAVSEGELLISGIVESRNGKAYYYHSIGEIIAEFEEEYVLKQDYTDIMQTYGKTKSLYSIKLFDVNIPLGIVPKGNNTIKINQIYNIGDFLTVEMYSYTEVKEDISRYDYKSAVGELDRRLEILEHGILSEYEILTRDIAITDDESGVTYIIKYKLKGDIGKQQPIFAK